MAAMEDLSLEVLQHICDLVASDYKPSLYDFALVCKRWSLASNAIRFQKIRLIIQNQGKLSHCLDHWNDTLRSTSSFRSVRRLEIEGHLPADGSTWVERPLRRRDDCMVDTDDELESAIYSYYSSVTELPEVTMELDKHWAPLALFVAQLRALQDLVFNCTNQFPPCLLGVLHQILPNCRLHLHIFGLKNLYSYKDWSRSLDRHEYALATSPSLHCITLFYDGRVQEKLVDYHDLAVMRMSQGLAPNLRHVRVVVNSISQITYNRRTERRPKRDIFPNDTPNPDVRGELYTMRFSGVLFGGLRAWNERIVFSSLRELILDTVIDPFSLREASTYNFSSLKTLVLRLESDNQDENDMMDGAASGFLRSLPPLTVLKLVENFGPETFKAIIDCHTSLQRIWLSPQRKSHPNRPEFTLDLDKVQDLASHCSELRAVCLLVPRTLYHSKDKAIYQSIGSLPHLRDLCLYLDCLCHHDFSLYISNQGASRLRFAKIKNTLLDAALNEDIARDIFHEVYQAQSQQTKPVFERLRIQSVRVRLSKNPPGELSRLLDVTTLGFSVTIYPIQGYACRETDTLRYRPPHMRVTANPHIPDAAMRRIQQL